MRSGYIYKVSKAKVITFPQLSKMSKKIVLTVQLNCKKCKRKAMETVAGIEGVESVAIDGKDHQITVIGDADPVCLTTSLRKFGFTELVSVGPSKDEKEKTEGDKKGTEISNLTYVILQECCYGCSGYTYYWSNENPNACSIL